MLDNLIFLNESDSIRQVVASVFSPQLLLNPERFKSSLEELKDYQKFELIQEKSIDFKLDLNQVENTNYRFKNVGFRFVGFEGGQLSKILRGENYKINNQEGMFYNFTSLKYPKWLSYKKLFLDYISVLSKEETPFVSAISLNYLNEFNWNSPHDIPVSEIFNSNAEFLSTKLFNSQDTSFLLKTEESNMQGFKRSVEKIEIVVSKQKRIVQVNSQLVFEFNSEKKLSDELIIQTISPAFEKMHDDIKNTLKRLFTEELKKKMNLI